MSDFNWLSISIVVESESDDSDEGEKGIANTSKMICPRIGEYIWMPYNWERKEEFGTTSFMVTDVAHHILPDAKKAYDSIVVYVKPVK